MKKLTSRIILLIIFSFSFIYGQKKITITSPTMNDPISADGEIEIIWNSSDIDGKITIQWNQTIRGSGQWKEIDQVNVIEKSYTWYLPDELANYKEQIIIRIFSNDHAGVNDKVTIGSPKLAITAYDKIQKPGEDLIIRWNVSIPVRMYYSIDGTKARYLIKQINQGNSTSWKVPLFLAGLRLKIELEIAEDKGVSDFVYVDILVPSLEIDVTISDPEPKPGSYLVITWNIFKPVNLYYTQPYSKRVKIFYSMYGNIKYSWRVPEALAGKTIKITVEDAEDKDATDSIFITVKNLYQTTVQKKPLIKGMKINVDRVSPKPGDYLTIGWNINKPVNLYYKRSGLPRVKIIQAKLGLFFRWKIPEELAGQRLRITVENAEDDGDFDYSFVEVKGRPKVVTKTVNNKQVGYLTITTSSRNAKVKIKGYKYPLDLPLALHQLKIGKHPMKMYKKGYETKKKTVFIFRGEETKYRLFLEKKSNNKALLYSLIYPGGGQLYAGNTVKGLTFVSASTGIAALLVGNSLKYNDLNGNIDTYRIAYENATSQLEIDATWNQYQSKVNELNNIQDELIGYGLTLGFTWVVNLIDAYFWSGL